MATITLGSTTIWNSSTTGRGWSAPRVTPIIDEAIIERAPQGTGYWIKPSGKSLGSVSLECIYQGDRHALLATLEAIDQYTLGTLTLPDSTTFSNCRLASFSISYPDGAPDIATVSFQFERFPS